MLQEKDDYNVQAAAIHILGDLVQSAGVVVAAILIQYKPGGYDYLIADPICTLLFAIIVVYCTIPIIKECLKIIMEGTPRGFDLEDFEKKILEIPEIEGLHDVHVWSLTQGKPAMTAHIDSKNPTLALLKATKLCRKLGIYHSTIQVENVLDKEAKISFINCKQNIHD